MGLLSYISDHVRTAHIPEVVHKESIGPHWFPPDTRDRPDPDLTNLTVSWLRAARYTIDSHTRRQKSQDRDLFFRLARSSENPPLDGSILSSWQRWQSFELLCFFFLLSGLRNTTFRAVCSSTSYFQLLSSCRNTNSQISAHWEESMRCHCDLLAKNKRIQGVLEIRLPLIYSMSTPLADLRSASDISRSADCVSWSMNINLQTTGRQYSQRLVYLGGIWWGNIGSESYHLPKSN